MPNPIESEDLWETILAKLPLKIVTRFKPVCKQWKSLVESPVFRNLFVSHHKDQNSQSSSWSLMNLDDTEEVLARYRCDTWGLERSLGSYISSFLTDKFDNHKGKDGQARVVAYTSYDGLILILQNRTFYVANPVSRECVEIDPPPVWFDRNKLFFHYGIATQTDDNGVVLSYKVVVYAQSINPRNGLSDLSLMIYSSATGLWNLEPLHLPFISCIMFHDFFNPISLNGNLHWRARRDNGYEVILSIDFYATSVQCRGTPFPDLEKFPRFRRVCTTSQGCLMYINVDSDDHKLHVWKLSSWEWQLVSKTSTDVSLFGYIPLGINPFDATTTYFWSKNRPKCLLAINLRSGKLVFHNNELEPSGNMEHILRSKTSLFSLPLWLHRIPNTVKMV
ncbi:unnamed protein product [Microthlaspi erraticum]|uniref:Uncharacterized protein n=1 Tax=Microthlaspi erraticum TaxID=1685480 RepID=A0A6D2KF63_9BRAS|nr:unnamed protein product [Microthlaspi erraticum]